MYKVLVVLTDLRAGNGTASAIMPYLEYIMNKNYRVDFLLFNRRESPWSDVIEKHGSRILYVHKSKFKYGIQTRRSIKKAIDSDSYDLIHVNIVGPYAAQIMRYANNRGVGVRIWHSHSTLFNTDNKKIKLFDRIKTRIEDVAYRQCMVNSNYYIACSEWAGKSRFGEQPYCLLKNCINVKKFIFDPVAREQLRRAYKTEDNTFVVGTVARMSEEKNPFFSFEVFKSIKEIYTNTVFVWVGEGTLHHELISYVEKIGISESVLFVGNKPNVQDWYSMMDCFILPSFFEGLPVTLIEAQTSGLMCFSSTMMSPEVAISPNLKMLSLELQADEWAKTILKNRNQINRSTAYQYTIDAGYDISCAPDQLERIYMDALSLPIINTLQKA